MSTQEMEQMDREVMAMVNNHANPEAEEAAEEILQEQERQGMNAGDSSAAVPPQNDTSSVSCADTFPRGEGLEAQRIHEEEFAELEKQWRRKKNRQTVLCVALCVLIAAALLATLAKPELLIWLGNVGVACCITIAGITVDRWIRRKGW